MPADQTIEHRLRAVEDRLAIYNLIASHPPTADTGSDGNVPALFSEDAVLDLGGTKIASRAEAIAGMLRNPDHHRAIRGGLCHFAGLPHVAVDGDRAVATSYLQIIAPHPTAEEIEVPAHGKSRGYRIHRVGANRWELARTPQGWRIERRTYRALDGTEPALDLLRQAVEAPTSG